MDSRLDRWFDPKSPSRNALRLSRSVVSGIAILWAISLGTPGASGQCVAVERDKLVATGATFNEYLGSEVSISGDRALVGSIGDDGFAGAAHVFHWNGVEWTDGIKLTASDREPNDQFGNSVSIDGDVAVVGAHQENAGGFRDTGSVYVFRFDGVSWNEEQKIPGSGPVLDNNFGYSVSVLGDLIAIGEYRASVAHSNSGAVHLYRYDGNTWTLEQKVTSGDSSATYFGFSVDLSPDKVVIGAVFDTQHGSFSGSAYVFGESGGTWTLEQRLTASNAAQGHRFGTSVGISDDGQVVCVGAIGAGRVYVFRFNGSSWTEEAFLNSDDQVVGDNFGTSVAISGRLILVGAHFHEDFGFKSGAAYLFSGRGSTWTQEVKINASDESIGDEFGGSVAIDGDRMLIASAKESNRAGAAYVFDGADLCRPQPGVFFSHLKISDTEGRFNGNLVDGESFGWSVDYPGDIDGDGIEDLVMGTYGKGVWVLFLRPDGSVRTFTKINEGEGGFTGDLDEGDFFGSAVQGIGDLDLDGIPDLAVGASGDDDGSPHDPGQVKGAVWIMFLNADGTVKSHQKISATAGGFGGPLMIGDGFGFSLGLLPDMDGDGIDELVAGAPFDRDGGTWTGALWILFLDSDGTVKSEQKISATAGGFAGTLTEFDQMGFSVDSIGDLNGDGVPDLCAGAIWDRNSDFDLVGAIWIIFLNPDGTVLDQRKIDEDEGGFSGSLHNSSRFGRAVCSIGDLNADGVEDVAVGETGDQFSATGSVWILYLNPDGTVLADEEITEGMGGFTGSLDNGDDFGGSLARKGEIGPDSSMSLAVGAYRDNDGGQTHGAVWILEYVPAPVVTGSVALALTGGATEVLFVNGLTGQVNLAIDESITLDLNASPAGPDPARFVVWIWATADSNPLELAFDSQSLGVLVNPTPLQRQLQPQPFRALVGGLPNPVSRGIRVVPSPATAPFSATRPQGLHNPIVFTLQGLLEDSASASATGYSVTNSVVLRIE